MIYQFLALLVFHWVSDFVLQTHWQASNKSKSNNALGRHVAVYTVALLFVTPFIFQGDSYRSWAIFIGANGVLHFATDYVTSRMTSRLYAKQDWHNFFVVVGLDQLIHQFTLAISAIIIFS